MQQAAQPTLEQLQHACQRHLLKGAMPWFTKEFTLMDFNFSEGLLGKGKQIT